MAPSTFASAAAGNASNSTRDGSSDWSRRPNGATQTFRRPSNSTSLSSITQQSDGSSTSQPPPRYVPPHRNGTLTDTRYSRDQLLDLYKTQQSLEGGLKDGLSNLLMSGWQPDIANGLGGSSWGRSEQSRDNQSGPELCWDKDGSTEPLGLIDMDDEEREIFSTSVNTPLRPPTSNKENQQSNGPPGRKISISNQPSASGGYGPLSPTSTRGPGRRRDTSESFQANPNQVSSPTSGFNRDEQRTASPPPSLTRRRTDLKDSNKPADREADSDDKSTSGPFGSLKRTTTGPLSAGFGAPSSPWSNAPQSAGMSPMGSFGNFGLGQQSTQTEKRPSVAGGRSESRFKNLLNKEGSEDAGSRTVERKTSMSSLSRVMENESWRPQQPQDFGNSPLDEAEEGVPVGSAAMGADADMGQMHQRQRGFPGLGTPGRSDARDDFGFGAFGMTSDNNQGFGQGFPQQTPYQQRQMGGNEPMSPTDTNPYKSPEQHGIDRLGQDLDPDMADIQNAQLPGLGGFGNEQQHFGGFGGLGAFSNQNRPGGGYGPASDRSQTSSAGANRGFPGLGGLGPLGGVSGAAAWPVSQGGIGTPGRQTSGMSNAFGGGLFSSGSGDMQSPSLAGLGGGMLSPQAGMGGNRMTSMFPSAMQDQLRQGEQDSGGSRGPPQPFSGLGEYARPGDGSGDFQGTQNEQERSFEQQPAQYGAPGQQAQKPIGQPSEQSQEPSRSQQQSAQGQAQNQLPPPQQRTMVMPDRMRWIYRDPQGQTQGPWTGLEMHDWYKAGFFSPELLVKKYEDPDYEPLAQLIRRIGNSREPFLVPQIGIPHGPAGANTGPNAWAGSGQAQSAAPAAPAGAQPPFASSFPSFGTTLTAEQQNALERRKQEEQYLMARQKEHLAQAQIAQRMQHHQMPPGGPSQQGGLVPGQGQLQHQGSAQSLHSQPSFGSMTSPTAGPYHSSPSQGPQGQSSGFFDSSFRGSGQPGGMGAVGAGIDNLGHIREEEIPGIMDRLSMGDRAAPGQFGAPGQPFSSQQQVQSPSAPDQRDQQIQQMLRDRALLQQEQAQYDAAQQQSDDTQATANERLQQFQQLQGATGTVDARFQPAMGQSATALNDEQSAAIQSGMGSSVATQDQQHGQELSLTEQVQQAASAQQSPMQQRSAFPQPFPPAPSQSPLPAPAAQRSNRHSVADQLQTEQRESPDTAVETPSAAVAPWAEKSTEAARGPSLKEIQEMEAKKAAEAEEMASAARRAAFQKEMEAQAHVVPPAPGLPASASWAAAGGSPATPTSGSSAWSKAAQKPSGPATAKSMAQIQKEEEARKKKLAAASAQATAMAGAANAAVGKSYANLAGKVATPPASQSPTGGAWTTVGASGKPKTPGAPVPPPVRTMSSNTLPPAQPAATSVKKAPARSATTSNTGVVNAQEEFRKWAVGELRSDLNKGISAEAFVSDLISFPEDLIREAVHGYSSTIDSKHFTEEFLRRKMLAEKGLVDSSAPPKSASPHNANIDKSGGWSEVAKKGPVKEASKDESNGNFRVVASKKKGAKR